MPDEAPVIQTRRFLKETIGLIYSLIIEICAKCNIFLIKAKGEEAGGINW
jgi:hypothetical protein